MNVFIVVAVTREDVEFALDHRMPALSDTTMQAIAEHMSDAFLAAGPYYWDAVTDAASAVLEEENSE